MRGRVIDRLTGNGISYAIINEINCVKATTSNCEGYYEITLNSKNKILVFSCLGYTSDTISVDTGGIKNFTGIYLTPATEIQKILPGSQETYTASGLINKALNAKKAMYANLKNYEFTANNRYVTRENDGVGIGTGTIKIDWGLFKESIDMVSNIWKTKPMRINSINEFISEGSFYSPSSYSEVIESHKLRSLPSSVNTLLGTRRIQNLSCDELKFYDRPFPGPLSSDALNYYRYLLQDTLLMDNQKIFKIYFEPLDKSDPGLTGYLYISDLSNSIVKIEGSLNQGANTGNLFESVSVTQQFISCGNGIYLPVDYRMDITSNYIGIIKTEYELSSLIGNYVINSETSKDTPQPILTVLPESVELDSSSGSNMESIPLTLEEETAYQKIDSIRSQQKGFIYGATKIISPQYQLNNNISISGPLSIYQFNHVEGHTLGFSGSINSFFNNTTDARIAFSHGFSDKRSKENLAIAYHPYEDRAIIFSLNAYNKISMVSSATNRYSSFTSTIYSLLSKRDIRNFYYTNGFDIGLDGEVLSFMRMNIGYSNHTDNSAITNTTFSLLGNRSRNFNSNNNSAFQDSVNAPIFEARLNTISFGVNFDFRDNVVENNLKRKVSNGHTFLSFGAGILISSPKYLGSDIGFKSYSANILTEINTFKTSSLSIEINAIYSKGPVPLQMQYALPGNISGTGRNFTFRTVGVGNIFGDQTFTVNLEYNIRKEIYRLLPVSLLQNFSVSTFFNAAWKNMSDRSAAIMPIPFSVLTQPLLETGFSVGYSSLPVGLEFAWRLTHIERSRFSIGINTSIL